MKRIVTATIAGLALLAVGAWASADVPKDVVKLIQKRCAGCHKGNFPPKGLNLEPDRIAAILDAPSREVPALKIVDTKAPGSSYLLRKVRGESDILGKRMPLGKVLAAEDLRVLETWIGGLGIEKKTGFNIFGTF
jgi:hypothetical protein